MKIFCIALAAAAIFPLRLHAEAQLANAIEAVVHDSVITFHEVSSLNEQTYDMVLRQYRTQPSILEKKLSEMRGENLEKLLDRELILHEFKTAGYSLPESVLNDLVQERIKADFGDRATLTKTLQARGMSYERFRQQVKDRFIVEALRAKNINQEIIISPHKIEQYYLTHKDDFNVEDEVKLRVIVLKAADDPVAPPALQLAGEILTKLNDGGSFAEMAKLYSQGSQRNQSGDWGWWQKTQLTKGLADVAYALQVGKHSGVFSRSPGDDYWVYLYENGAPVMARRYGVDQATKKQKMLEERRLETAEAASSLPAPNEFYLLKVDETRQAHFKALGEVRDQIEKNLLLDERTRLEKAWIERLKKKTFVRYF